MLLSAVLPAVCEETLFRGALLSAWEEKGSAKAMLIVSVLFMLLHGSVTGIPSELAAGLILCFLAISTGSVFAGIIFHTVYNSAILSRRRHPQRTGAELCRILTVVVLTAKRRCYII